MWGAPSMVSPMRFWKTRLPRMTTSSTSFISSPKPEAADELWENSLSSRVSTREYMSAAPAVLCVNTLLVNSLLLAYM